ncbi:hypothetical protein DFH11DRAFT_340559 [Phellopilus nigrolimitatus]|nr:hypothetical protein DFH11DRAFT_340559 [Phellopilus nigrolimitatus]
MHPCFSPLFSGDDHHFGLCIVARCFLLFTVARVSFSLILSGHSTRRIQGMCASALSDVVATIAILGVLSLLLTQRKTHRPYLDAAQSISVYFLLRIAACSLFFRSIRPPGPRWAQPDLCAPPLRVFRACICQ